MRQTRLSIGCRDWRQVIETLGAQTAGILLYLRTLMRSMQAAEISIRIEELAAALHISEETAAAAIESIEAAGHLTQTGNSGGVITLRSSEEAAAIAERERKRRAAILRKIQGQALACGSALLRGRTKPEIPAAGREATDANAPKPRENGALGAFSARDLKLSGLDDCPASNRPETPKSYYTETPIMTYTGNSGRTSPAPIQSVAPRADGTEKSYTAGNSGQKNKKNPHTPEKEKSLTEQPAPAHTQSPLRETELPADQLEADYIDVCGAMPQSLRTALREQHDDVREAFCLYCRKKRDELGSAWTADAMRVAWLAARRIPEERRADSILAAYMGGWKTIRDSGSGVYFDKATGRVMSLVRGPVSTVNPAGGTASKSALDFARKMRRA